MTKLCNTHQELSLLRRLHNCAETILPCYERRPYAPNQVKHIFLQFRKQFFFLLFLMVLLTFLQHAQLKRQKTVKTTYFLIFSKFLRKKAVSAIIRLFFIRVVYTTFFLKYVTGTINRIHQNTHNGIIILDSCLFLVQ